LLECPLISVVIVNYNSGSHLADAVTALAAQSLFNFETIVVDNCSTDQSIARARSAVKADERFIFSSARTNLGFAAGNNFGAQRSRGKWLAFLNPDAVPAADWLEQLLAATHRHANVVMFGSTQIDAADPRRLDGAGDHYFATGIPWRGGRGRSTQGLPREREVFAPCAAACFIRADAFRKVGGFDERFFCYVEDIDLAFRLRLLGHRCIQVADATVRHFGAASSAQMGSDFADQYGIRNLIWCFVKCMPGPLFWPLLPFHIMTVAALSTRAAARGEFRPVGEGIVLALQGMGAMWISRRAVQRSREIPSRRIASALSWNPIACLRRLPQRGGSAMERELREQSIDRKSSAH
jgi:GT2 family glycosyltransferase